MDELNKKIKELILLFGRLNQREKVLVSSVICSFIIFLVFSVLGFLSDIQDDKVRVLNSRKNQLNEIIKVAQRYNVLNQKKESLQKKFSDSQLTFDQVTLEVDKIIKEAAGEEKYELTKPRSAEPFGFEFQKQDFNLSIKNINMDQLVKLLYLIENGGKPLYLSKLDITRIPVSSTVSATLEIYSIGQIQNKNVS